MVNFLSSTALKIFALFSILIETTSAVDSNACSACTSICTIIPPAGSTFPCYEGTPANTKSCYNTDPLIQSGSTYQCTACTDLGYPYYLQNDPVYVNMELWGKKIYVIMHYTSLYTVWFIPTHRTRHVSHGAS